LCGKKSFFSLSIFQLYLLIIVKLKGIMTKFKYSKPERKVLINMLLKNLDIIIQNPYGNYALQHAIDV